MFIFCYCFHVAQSSANVPNLVKEEMNNQTKLVTDNQGLNKKRIVNVDVVTKEGFKVFTRLSSVSANVLSRFLQNMVAGPVLIVSGNVS